MDKEPPPPPRRTIRSHPPEAHKTVCAPALYTHAVHGIFTIASGQNEAIFQNCQFWAKR